MCTEYNNNRQEDGPDHQLVNVLQSKERKSGAAKSAFDIKREEVADFIASCRWCLGRSGCWTKLMVMSGRRGGRKEVNLILTICCAVVVTRVHKPFHQPPLRARQPLSLTGELDGGGCRAWLVHLINVGDCAFGRAQARGISNGDRVDDNNIIIIIAIAIHDDDGDSCLQFET